MVQTHAGMTKRPRSRQVVGHGKCREYRAACLYSQRGAHDGNSNPFDHGRDRMCAGVGPGARAIEASTTNPRAETRRRAGAPASLITEEDEDYPNNSDQGNSGKEASHDPDRS